MLNVTIYLLLGILIITSALMVLIVLMQRPKNEGLGAAFGGGMTQDLFGAQTTNVLQKFTVYLGALFFGVSLLLTVLYSRQSTQKSEVEKNLAASAAAIKPKEALPAPTPSEPLAPPAATATPASDSVAPLPSVETPVPAVPTVESTPAPEATAMPSEAAPASPTPSSETSPTP